MFDIKENLKKLPDKPGVYIHRDSDGGIIYVGKAISLRNRVRQYFQSSRNMDPKVRAMVKNIASFEYILCDNEMEALILECNLIKENHPKYNILLRDDKTYPYIKVTMNEEFPRIVKTRLVDEDGSKYFGPYSDAGAVNRIIDFLENTYKLKRCSITKFPKGKRPCLNYHINNCRGICTGNVSRDEYMESLNKAVSFLNGNSRPLKEEQLALLKEAAEQMDFEQAAVYRDNLEALDAITEKQRVVLRSDEDMDVLVMLNEKEAVLFYVRDGKLTGREIFALENENNGSEEEMTESFIKQYYSTLTRGPKEILVRDELKDRKLIEDYLTGIWGRKVSISVPKRGAKKALLDLALNDIEQIRKNREAVVKKRESLKAYIDDLYRLQSDQMHGYRAEAYDISDINGIDSVGAMVVFDEDKKRKKDYRRFRIRTIDQPDDYGSIKEVLYRRIKRAQEGDKSFSTLPDIFFIDGGKGHVHAAKTVLDAMRVGIPVFGMAKDDSHRTKELVYEKDGEFLTVDIKGNPVLFSYIGNMQEEVHRFAIDYHRSLRTKKMTVSELDNIKGIGPAKRTALLKEFGSVEEIRKADKQRLTEVSGISEANAENILKYFRG